MYKIIALVVFLMLLIPSLSPCYDLREEVRERRMPTYIIENQSYLSLRNLLRIINCEDSWGRIEDRVFIIYNDKEIRFRIDEDVLLIGSEKRSMRYPVKEIEGEILIPVQEFQPIFARAEKPVVVEPSADEPLRLVPEERRVTERAPKQREDFVVLIDPGHGGRDSGAIGNFGLKEKDVVLDVANRMRDFLARALRRHTYVKIAMVRDTDVFVSLEDRVRMANELGADVFFSIHANSSLHRRADVTGFETFYPISKEDVKELPAPSNVEGLLEDVETEAGLVVFDILQDLNRTTTLEDSRILAEFVQNRLAERLLTPDRGAKRRNFYVLRYTPMVSILTEIEFLCNPNVELNLRDAEVRHAIAVALGNSLIDYLEARHIIPEIERP